MTCNGNNHDPFCQCPWRGGNSFGNPSFSDIGGSLVFKDFADSPGESYLNPNAKCPVCGDLVIFYRSPYDGRVYFDPPIGYPWPKHPCTNSTETRTRDRSEGTRVRGDLPKSEGWYLFAIDDVRYTYPLLSVQRELNSKEREYFEKILITGRLIILRRRQGVKVIKRGRKGHGRMSVPFVDQYSENIQLTLETEMPAEWLNRWYGALSKAMASIRLSNDNKSCSVSIVPGPNNDGAKFEAQVLKIRDIRKRLGNM